ncbi:hypothetical protein [Hydrogenophaga sp. Root209]|uniref:hypothetical protein n=1 Tax=Hydrogenophaga sp. Root209 TaxID=1736490 RepID=UPI000AA181D6|nr:hypothetical protein [Hydrogenophaga sp. Root209]
MLASAQSSLERHFSALASARVGHDSPVYAFEHGLAVSELAAIRTRLEAQLREVRRPLHEYWLLWSIVAAEVGYSYDGDEYWQSFSQEVPSWRLYGDRNLMRDWFRVFANRFAGFSPRGRWADHFSIISWPITHSILPRYLQAHFAAHLHDMRYDLAQYGDLGIVQLGSLIQRRYYGGSARFRDFLQQTELTARLVLALRDEDIQGDISPIDRSTLGRIVGDLEEHQAVRHQLQEARKVLREARFRSSQSLVGRPVVAPQGGPRDSKDVRVAGAKLMARGTPDGAWRIGIAMPDFTGILRSEDLQISVLDKPRIRFSNDDGRWMPGRALLSYSRQHRPLSALTDAGMAFMEIDGADARLRALLQPFFKLQGSFPLLLKIYEDGVARQVHGNHVRADQGYLIVTSDPLSGDTIAKLELKQVVCAIVGVVAYELSTPAVLAERHFQALKQLRFGYGLRGRVEPVGLLPRRNGESTSTWLPSEEVILRLSADFAVSEFVVVVDAEPAVHIQDAGNSDALVSFGMLPIGVHVVQVTAVAKAPGQRLEPEQLFLQVRSPEPWQESARKQAGVRLVMEPANASLQDVLKGKAKVSALGPRGRFARIDTFIRDAHGHDPAPLALGNLDLPIDSNAMDRVLQKLDSDAVMGRIESAARIDIDISSDELGHDRLSFHQEVQPLRWKLEHRDRSLLARLVDEAGADQAVVVRRYDLRNPDRYVAVKTGDCYAGVSVPAPGALFVARHRGRRYAAVVSLRERVTSLADLGARVDIGATRHTRDRTVAMLLVHYRRWHGARALGPLSSVHRSKVLSAFELQLARILCRGTWADRANACLTTQGLQQSNQFDQLQREVGGSPGFAIAVSDEAFKCSDVRDLEHHFVDKAHAYRVSSDTVLSAMALALAFCPAEVRFDNWLRGQEMLRALIANPTLVRGAYLAKLAKDIGRSPGEERVAREST